MSHLPVDILLKLVRIALGLKDDAVFPSDVNWKDVMELSVEQGMAALAADGLQKVYETAPDQITSLGIPSNKSIKYDWFGTTLNYEIKYEEHERLISELSSLFEQNGIKTMVFKGLGIARYYPIPSHRATGDIDVFLFYKGAEADKLVNESFCAKVKHNEDKHSVFKFHGVSVENHATFVNVVEFPYSADVERFLEDQASMAPVSIVGGANVYLPTVMMDAVFLPSHIAGHFVYGGLSLKQMVDWAVFVSRFGREIDWKTVERLSRTAGSFRFFRVLNGIIIDHFGVDAICLPPWDRDPEMEERVWKDFISFPPDSVGGSKLHRAARYLSSRWKYKLVFRENFILTFFRRAWASFRGHYLPNSRSVWEREKTRLDSVFE